MRHSLCRFRNQRGATCPGSFGNAGSSVALSPAGGQGPGRRCGCRLPAATQGARWRGAGELHGSSSIREGSGVGRVNTARPPGPLPPAWPPTAHLAPRCPSGPSPPAWPRSAPRHSEGCADGAWLLGKWWKLLLGGSSRREPPARWVFQAAHPKLLHMRTRVYSFKDVLSNCTREGAPLMRPACSRRGFPGAPRAGRRLLLLRVEATEALAVLSVIGCTCSSFSATETAASIRLCSPDYGGPGPPSPENTQPSGSLTFPTPWENTAASAAMPSVPRRGVPAE